jgi:hypothetical protein
MPVRPLLAFTCLTVMLLAGCAGNDPGAQPADAALPAAGSGSVDLATLDANSSLQAPAPWALGDWFGVHVFVGMEDTEGTHYNTVVVEETPTAWVLATDDAGAAKEEAVFDFPIMGPFEKDDLGTSGLGGRWDLLQFPLSDKATWSSRVAMDPLDPTMALDLEFEATFNPRIQTADGPQPGYDIVAVDEDARNVLSFDYVPSVGWFTRFMILDTATEDPLDYFISARSMGTGHGWKGTYFIDTATPLLQHLSIVGVDPGNPTAPFAQPSPHATFAVSETATYLFGFAFSFSFAGAHEMVLLDPANQPREFRSYNAVMAGEDSEVFIDEAAIAGTWNLMAAGGGVVAGGGAFLWEITETTGTL